MKKTAENIEVEAALVRSQLVTVGIDIRHHVDPAVIVAAAKTSFKRRTENVPTFLKPNAAKPIGLVMLGGACGAVLTGLLSRSSRSARLASNASDSSTAGPSGERPNVRSQANAALLSGVGIGLGYLAGMFVPKSSTEERLLGEPKAVLSQHFDDFLKTHKHGVEMAAAKAFGISRLSAVALVGLAMLAEALGKPTRPSNPKSL